jgi:DNA-binding NarL/FixJ family response regulator
VLPGRRALLGQGSESRPEGIKTLRHGYELARQLGAESVQHDLLELARTARVGIEAEPPGAPMDATVFPGPTTREREILDHLVRGSTYAEIAATFVISEKTVSSHVSNLLRKTGTSSRVELSRLAARLSLS